MYNHASAQGAVPPIVQGPASRRMIDRIVMLTISFYWLMQFTHGDAITIISPDTAFYLSVGPAAVFAVICIAYALARSRSIDRSAWLLILFCGSVIIVSLSRADYRTIMSIGLFSSTIAVLFQIRPRITLNFLNILLLLSGPITTLMYWYDYSIYTVFPGIGSSADLWWRISPLPSVAEGAIFATFVFIINLAAKDYRYRLVMLAISGYFIILSGSRTGISAIIGVLLYWFMTNAGLLATRAGKTFFLGALIVGFIALIYGSELLMASPFANNVVLRTLILRDEAVSGFDFEGQVGTAAIRRYVFDQHMAAFWESPLVGIGTFDLSMLNSGYGRLDDSGTGSEAFVTGLLARIGLLSSVLFYALFLTKQVVADAIAELSTMMRLALFIAMLTYGSFANAYDLVFVLMIIAVAGGIEVPMDHAFGAKGNAAAAKGVARWR